MVPNKTMRRLWLLFTQAVTVSLAVLFVITTLRPQWLPQPAPYPGRLGAGVVSNDGRAATTTPADSNAEADGSVPENVESAPDALASSEVQPHSAERDAVQQPPTAALQQEAPPGTSYAAAVARAASSVVSVYTRKHIKGGQRPFAQGPDIYDLPGLRSRVPATSLGSGVIVRDDGYILTNYHVVEAADAIEVTLADSRQAVAKLVGADPESDLAVIHIDLPGLTAITMGDEAELHVGDVVLAIGNPFGVGQTTTMGIVSALGRSRLGLDIYENFIQTDAAINPGNSGGALVNADGHLVGINTAIYSESGGALGIGFAIPARAAGQILDEIIQKGHVSRGWLGVEPQDITAELAQAFGLETVGGVILARVQRDGPAGRAGMKVGDIIVAMEETLVTDAVQFLALVAAREPDESVVLHLLRDGERHEMRVRLGERPPVAGR